MDPGPNGTFDARVTERIFEQSGIELLSEINASEKPGGSTFNGHRSPESSTTVPLIKLGQALLLVSELQRLRLSPVTRIVEHCCAHDGFVTKNENVIFGWK